MDRKNQPISTEQLESVSYGDDAFKKELIEIFLEQIPEFISNMRLYFENEDLTSLAKEVHTAKSSVLIFGMTETGHSLKKIQLYSEENNTEPIASLIENVDQELNHAASQLKIILQDL